MGEMSLRPSLSLLFFLPLSSYASSFSPSTTPLIYDIKESTGIKMIF